MTFEIDAETAAYVGEIQAAPTLASLDVSQDVVMGHFAERDSIVPTDSKGAEYVVAPPISYDT